MNTGVTLRSGKVLQPNTQEMDFEDSLWSVLESPALLDTQAALNPDDIVALGGCQYVRIEDKTFSVVFDSDVDKGSVMVSPASAADFDEDEVELIPIDETIEAESAHFVLSSGFELPFQGERLLTLSALTKLFHERYDGQILSQGDEFEFSSGLVARFTLPQQSDLEEGTQNYLVSEATRFFFHPEEGEEIKVVEEVVPAEPLQFRYHVTLPQKEDEELFSFLAPNPRHEAGTSASVFPKLINIAELETHLRNALAGQLLTEGSSLSLPIGLTLQLTTVSTPHALPSCFLEILSVEKAYRFTPQSSISLSSDVENVHLVKGKPVRASSVKFLITEIMGESATRRKEMTSSWLLKTELEEKIRSVLSDFVLTTRFSITHRGVVYSLQVVDASAETVQREHRLDEQSYWIFGRNCTFEVKAAEALNVHVVTDATPRILKKVTFQVASCGHAETQIAVSAEELKLAIRSELGGVILPGCSYKLTVGGAHLELSVQRALFNEEGLNSSPDIYFGGINAATEIGLRTKTGSNLLIRSTPQPINADDPIEALATLGLAGYDSKVVQAIRMLCLPYGQSRELAAQLGVEAPKGILLKGPPGTGKSSLAHALCKVLGVAEGNIKEISADMVKSMWLGKTEENIRALFEPAQKAWEQGCKDLFVIIIDEIDALAAKRGGIDEHGNKFTNALLSQMDGLNKFGNVLVIGTTNHDTLIDPAFLRPGRFDKQLHFRLPNLEGRKNIFAIHLRALENQRLLHPDIDLTSLSKMTDGMNGSHIEGIVKRAKDLCLLRTSGRKLPKNSPERKVSMADLTSAYEYISDKGDVLENLPFMDQVGCAIPPEQLQEFFKVQGLVGLKEEQSHTLALVAAAYRPHPQAMQQLNINPPRGVLFYGAPGTGKTKMMLALLKMMGVSRRRVACYHAREILQLIIEGKAHFDLKSLFSPAYESFKSDPASAELQVLMVEDLHLLKVGTALEAFLYALDQIRQLTNILVVATATKTKDLDLQMAQQPGRFDHTVKTKAPDYAQRFAFFEAALTDSIARSLTAGSFMPGPLCEATQGFTWGQLQKTIDFAKLELKRLVDAGITNVGISQNLLIEAARRVKRSRSNSGILRAAVSAQSAAEFLTKFGLHGAQKEVAELFNLLAKQYVKNPQAAAQLGLKPIKGILLAGPPGCGKTKTAEAVVNMLNVSEERLLVVTLRGLAADLKEGKLKDLGGLFKEAKKAAAIDPLRPWIVLIEDLDQFGDELLTEFTQMFDKVRGLTNLIVVGTMKTSVSTKLPEALTTHERFEKVIMLDHPHFESRLKQLEHHLEPVKEILEGVTAKEVASQTDGMTPGQLEKVVKIAKQKALLSLVEGGDVRITRDHFVDAVAEVKGGTALSALYI